MNRGLAKQAKKDFSGAIADLTEALKLKSDDAGIYFARATARQEAKDLSGALADYSKVIEMDSTNAQAFANRAVIEMLQGNKVQGDRDFDQAFKLDPNLKPQFKEFIEGQRIRPNR